MIKVSLDIRPTVEPLVSSRRGCRYSRFAKTHSLLRANRVRETTSTTDGASQCAAVGGLDSGQYLCRARSQSEVKQQHRRRMTMQRWENSRLVHRYLLARRYWSVNGKTGANWGENCILQCGRQPLRVDDRTQGRDGAVAILLLIEFWLVPHRARLDWFRNESRTSGMPSTQLIHLFLLIAVPEPCKVHWLKPSLYGLGWGRSSSSDACMFVCTLQVVYRMQIYTHYWWQPSLSVSVGLLHWLDWLFQIFGIH